jgi:hypothetical protein
LKHFPILRTRRLTVQFQELAIGDAISVASMPEHLTEAECTAFLKFAIKEVTSESPDPADWTVQERALGVAHYLASVAEDGPDFSLGQNKYSDFLDGTADISVALKQVPIGNVGDEDWEIRHLTGSMAESIERLMGDVEQLSPRLHWVVGAMAAQLVRVAEDEPALDTPALYDQWLLHRMQVLMNIAESDFEQLMGAYNAGREKLHHLFAYSFNEDGIVVLTKEGGAEGGSSARFSVSACLSRLARTMAGKAD